MDRQSAAALLDEFAPLKSGPDFNWGVLVLGIGASFLLVGGSSWMKDRLPGTRRTEGVEDQNGWRVVEWFTKFCLWVGAVLTGIGVVLAVVVEVFP